MIRVILGERGSDPAGAGHFGAPRGGRLHNGIDFGCLPGAQVLSPVTGKVTKLGYCYSKGIGGAESDKPYRYVEVTSGGHRHRVFYVEPLVNVGQQIIGTQTVIGEAQDVTIRYPDRGMTPHVHYEVMNERGQHINPSAP